MHYEDVRKPELSYPYEFAMNELDATQKCVEAHGFAVLKKVLPPDRVAELKAAVVQVVNANGDLGPGQSRTHVSFIEEAPALWGLLEYEPYMRSQKVFCQAGELTINRSAAIIRNPGSPALVWHSDWRGFSKEPPKTASDVLNRGPWPSGLWFYLTGSNPMHGGLAVIEDSHVADWPGPPGFALTSDGTSFYPEGSEPKGYVGFDVPGMVPLFTEPGDEIIFADRTYHAAFPNQSDEVRLSCAIGFRPRPMRIDTPWQLPVSARRFIENLPGHLQPLVENYVGIDPQWRGQGVM